MKSVWIFFARAEGFEDRMNNLPYKLLNLTRFDNACARIAGGDDGART
jgi:hypothetical protein